MSSPQRRLLVTGGAGFIGANFVHFWHEERPGDPVVVLDALTYAGNRMSLAALEQPGSVEFVQGDICDQALVERLIEERRDRHRRSLRGRVARRSLHRRARRVHHHQRRRDALPAQGMP